MAYSTRANLVMTDRETAKDTDISLAANCSWIPNIYHNKSWIIWSRSIRLDLVLYACILRCFAPYKYLLTEVRRKSWMNSENSTQIFIIWIYHIDSSSVCMFNRLTWPTSPALVSFSSPVWCTYEYDMLINFIFISYIKHAGKTLWK
jgi:hypothetical protein